MAAVIAELKRALRILSAIPGAVILLALVSIFILPSASFAYPFFSRQIGRDCAFCHSILPKLNETGRTFKSGGYRLPGEGEWKEVKDFTSLPASIEAEIEGAYNSFKTNGVKTKSSDLKIEELELIAGGAFGKTGKVSANATITFEETDTGADTSIHKAFVQVNDLLGPAGEGMLNVRAGKWEIGLPFLNTAAAITNRYLAESVLDVLSLEQGAIEINGSVVADEDSIMPTHRYSLGISREDVNSDDKLKGFYAAYAATFNEAYSIGALARAGKEAIGTEDMATSKYGIAFEAEGGPFILTAGYFRSNRAGASDADDYLLEALFFPLPKISLGARFEYLKEGGRAGVKSQSIMARYSILSNAFAQIEYRGLSDEGHVIGANEDEDKLRAFLVAVF